MLVPMNKLHAHRGLTMLELAVVLAVLAMLAAVAVPGLGARLERQRTQAAAEALQADLAEARFDAARRGHPLYVETAPGPAWCWGVATAPRCSCAIAQPCLLHAVQAEEHPRARLAQGLSLRLNADGTADAPQTAVLATSRGERVAVQVTAPGRTRLCAASPGYPKLPTC